MLADVIFCLSLLKAILVHRLIQTEGRLPKWVCSVALSLPEETDKQTGGSARSVCVDQGTGPLDSASASSPSVFFQTSNVSFLIHKPTVNYVNRSRWFFELFVCDTVIVFLLGQSVEWRSRMFNKINYYFYFFSTLLLFISTALWLYFQHGLLT